MNYQIRNGGHNYDLFTISFNDGSLMIRVFNRYTGSIEGKTVINNDNYYSDLTAYPNFSSLYIHQGYTYELQWYKQVSFDEHQLIAGGTYAVVRDIDACRIIRLDASKYPDLDISDWKWVRMQSFKPMIKFHIRNNSKQFNSFEWAFALNGEFESTAFVLNDTIESTVHNDNEVSILPQFEYSVNDRTLTIISDSDVNGKLNIINKIGNIQQHQIVMQNGLATVQLPSEPVCCDVLFEYNKVLEINELN